MKNFDDIKDLWQQGGSGNELPPAKQILSRINAIRKKMFRRNILSVIVLALTFAFIFWIGMHYDFEMISTRIGIIITLIAIVAGVIFNTKLANLLLKQNDPTLSNSEYLQQLIKFRNQQKLIQTKGISVYFILLTAGILLYMYEFASRNLTFGVIAYSITLGWIAFNWFYLRTKSIRKHEKEINEQISLMEGIINNLNGDK
jgi:amino acid permease